MRVRLPRVRPRSVRRRLVLFQVLVLGLAALVVDIAVFNLVATPLSTDMDGSLYDQAKTIEGAVLSNAGEIGVPGGPPPTTNDAGVTFEAVLVYHNQVVAAAGGNVSASATVLAAARRADEAQGGVYSEETVGQSHRRVYAEPATSGGAAPLAYSVVVTRSIDDLRGTRLRLILTLAAGSLAVVAVGGLLAAIVVGRALAPVRRMALTAAGIGDRELDRRVPNDAPDSELGELVGTFNGMLDRLQSSFAGLHQFTADASHELRAPLALMRTQVEVALTRDRTQPEYRELLVRLRDEIQHLGAIADQLLLLARSDANALTPVLEAVDVADLLHEEAVRWEPAARAGNVHMAVDAPQAGSVPAQPDLLRRVVDNLVDNALRFAPGGSTVRLSGRLRNGAWVIEVADAGPGLPDDLRPRLFQRFARSDSARDPQSGHAGLGLSVSAAIVAAHGGTIDVVDHAGPGATFRVTLPAAAPAAPASVSPGI